VASRPWLLGCVLSVVVLSQTPASRAQPGHPQPEVLDPRYEPAALRVLDELVRKYRNLAAYSDQGKLYLNSEINGKKSAETTVMHVGFTRPDKLMLRCAAIRFFCDGREAISVLDSSRVYVVDPLPKDWRMRVESIARYPGAASILGGISGLPTAMLLDLLTSDNGRKVMLAETDGLRLEKDPDDPKAARQCLFIDQHQGPDIRLFIDQKTGLMTEIQMMVDPSQLFARAPKGVVVDKVKFGWVSGPISEVPLNPKLIVFQPSPGYEKLPNWDSVIGLAGQHDPKMNQRANDFTLPVLDGPEKTRQLSLDDLKGKVVIIVFWASWSPPSFDQLAWVKKGLLDKYRDRGVVMLSVNIDDEAAEVNEARTRVVRILEEKKLALDQAPFSYVALDPVNSVGQALHLTTIPMTFILDRDRVVRFLFAGFKTNNPEPTHERLEKLLSVP
jgi:peroxiredoxin